MWFLEYSLDGVQRMSHIPVIKVPTCLFLRMSSLNVDIHQYEKKEQNDVKFCVTLAINIICQWVHELI